MNREDRYVGADFSDANLNGDILSGTFIGVDFTGANLSNATLNGTFIKANFNHANLANADMERGIFEDADFTDATLPEGGISGGRFSPQT